MEIYCGISDVYMSFTLVINAYLCQPNQKKKMAKLPKWPCLFRSTLFDEDKDYNFLKFFIIPHHVRFSFQIIRR
jgi:hypothetical protein